MVPISSAQPISASTLPDAYVGLSAADARFLRNEIERHVRERDVLEGTLTAIAARLRVDLSEQPFAVILQVLDERAAKAEAIRSELQVLTVRFGAIRSDVDRIFATENVTRARVAFDSGDLIRADQILKEITPMRGEALRVGLENWQDVVEMRAQVMLVSGRISESVDYRLEALKIFDQITQQSRFDILSTTASDAAREGARLPGVDLFRKAATIYEEELLQMAAELKDPFEILRVEAKYGFLLSEIASRVGGEEAIAILRQSIALQESTILKVSKSKNAYSWAAIRSNLGSTKFRLGNVLTGHEGTELLASAVTEYQASMEVYSKQAYPTSWAGARMNMAQVYAGTAERIESENAVKMLRRAEYAVLDALSVFSRQTSPLEWSRCQIVLGGIYRLQSIHVESREQKSVFLVRAIAALEAAIPFTSKEVAPVQWAMIQLDLATSYASLATNRGTVLERSQNLKNAEEAAASALLVFEREAEPVLWARVQVVLARIAVSHNLITRHEIEIAHVDKGIQHFEASLTVYSESQMPMQWAEVQVQLAGVYHLKSLLSDGELKVLYKNRAIMAMEQAAKAYGPNHGKSAIIRMALDRMKTSNP